MGRPGAPAGSGAVGKWVVRGIPVWGCAGSLGARGFPVLRKVPVRTVPLSRGCQRGGGGVKVAPVAAGAGSSQALPTGLYWEFAGSRGALRRVGVSCTPGWGFPTAQGGTWGCGWGCLSLVAPTHFATVSPSLGCPCVLQVLPPRPPSNHWAFLGVHPRPPLPALSPCQGLGAQGQDTPTAISRGFPRDPSPQWDPQRVPMSPVGPTLFSGGRGGLRRSLDCGVRAGGRLWDPRAWSTPWGHFPQELPPNLQEEDAPRRGQLQRR